MVVQHNLQAMNANRMLGVTQKAVASNTEKLSSGYRINRAADDAAGLSISEKMRKQIRGLDQAPQTQKMVFRVYRLQKVRLQKCRICCKE